jgi:hypothetical protein
VICNHDLAHLCQQGASKPVIYYGGGCQDARDELREFARKLKLPITSTLMVGRQCTLRLADAQPVLLLALTVYLLHHTCRAWVSSPLMMSSP